MNLVEANGGNKTQRDIAIKVVNYLCKRLMPRVRTLNIEIQFKKIKCDAIGYCMMTDDNRTFEIEIDKKQNIKTLVTTICHEMVHVKQYAKKEMDDGIRSGSARWKNNKYHLILSTTTCRGRKKHIVYKTNLLKNVGNQI